MATLKQNVFFPICIMYNCSTKLRNHQ